MDKLSYEITEQVIQCLGSCFHYKKNLEQFLVSCNVPKRIIEDNKGMDKAKFTWARDIMFELSQKDEHVITQKRIVTELCKLKNIHDNGVENRDRAMDSLRKLRILVNNHDNSVNREKPKSQLIVKNKTNKLNTLESLKEKYLVQMKSKNRQEAGFNLEIILKELFDLNGIKYTHSFRTENNTQQIDGHFYFEGFDYLVEAKWIQGKSSSAEIASFKRKIDTKISSTRGLFISINGFRDEVIQEYSGEGSKIIFMDGRELIYILEGIIVLTNALEQKIQDSVKFGKVYSKLY
ncbi:restriction endonuclease [Carnobacterium maltaromaticum]|uniref:restriction endonuclease n=1 Tax=Carnobacterium maltaromaticum TaxID=2751 RepID=UPI0039B0D294